MTLKRYSENVQEYLKEKQSICIIYKFSHDVPRNELEKSAKEVGITLTKLKVIASLHGIPRNDFIKEKIKEALDKAQVKYHVTFNGVVTKIIIVPNIHKVLTLRRIYFHYILFLSN